MSNFAVTVTPGVDVSDDTEITPGILRQIAVPQVSVVGDLSTASIADGSVTPAKLASSVAGNGLSGGAGAPLSVNIDNSTLTFASGVLEVASGGITPAQVQQGAFAYAAMTQTGTSNVYTGNLSPAPGSYTTGLSVRLKMDTINTGAVSVNLNTLGNIAVKKAVNVALAAGDISPGQIIELVYDGTNFQMIELPALPIQSCTGDSRGLVIQNHGGSTTAIDITATEIVIKNPAGNPFLATSVSLTVDLNNTIGSPLGLDTGSVTNGQWYYLWLIGTGNTVSAVLSASSTAPTLTSSGLSAYTYTCLVGAAYYNSVPAFTQFYQRGKKVITAEQVIFISTSLTGSLTLLSSTNLTTFKTAVPPIAVECSGTLGATTGAAAAAITVAATAAGIGSVTVSITGNANQDGFAAAAPFTVPLTQQNIAVSGTGSATNQINISGFTLP